MPVITEMFAFVVADKSPEDEGVIAYLDPGMGTWMPMVGADLTRVDALRPEAQKLADATGKKVIIKKFYIVDIIGTVVPRPRG